MKLKNFARPLRGVALFGSILAALAVATAFAQVPNRFGGGLRVVSPRVAQPRILATPTLAPRPVPLIAPGQTVPLSMLPPLRTHAIRGRRPMSATGATIFVTTVSGCASTLGTIYNVGCTVQWQSQNLPACSSGNCHQDYYIDANASSATAVGSPYGAAGAAHSQTLSHSGTYVLAVLNSNTNNWDAIVYITVGTATVFNTYSDPTDHNIATTFTASSSTTVYINATGLTPTDNYVVYAESTSITGQCAFIAPSASPTPGPTLCNPANSPGQNALGGTLNVPWQLSASLTPGTYSIVIYDLTTNTRLAQRQIAIVGSGATSSWTMTPTGGNPSPAPAPAGTPGSIFAFDSALDNSDTSVTFKATGLTTGHNYKVAISDPNGTVITTQTLSPGGGAISTTMTATQAESPENYIGHTYTVSLYDSTSSAMVTTSAFEILGYNVQGQFTSPIGTSLAINAPATSATSGVQFTNAGDLVYGVGNGDGIRGIVLDMGGQGITATLASGTSCGATCVTTTVTDSNGQTWNVTDVQSGNGANATSTITLYPAVSTQYLAIGATVAVPSITFNNPPGSHCSNGCTITESVLPLDGLTWSDTTQALGANPLYITNGFGSSYAATSHISLYGYRSGGALTAANDIHGFAPNGTYALYDASQPFSVASGQDVLAYTVTNTSSAGSGSLTKMQITFPSSFSVSSATIDTSSPTTWQTFTCPAGTPSNVLCIQKAGSNAGIPANGGSQTIYIDINAPVTSFAATDISGAATSPSNFSFAADGSTAVFAGSTATIDSDALAGYSLDSTKITPLVAPANVGANTSQPITISVQNASTVSDPNPDYLDAIVISVPSSTPLSALSSTTTGWSYLGSSTSGSNTFYWFGECAAQFSTANGPAVNPPPATSSSLPSCGAATEYTYSVAPSASASFGATISAGSSPITITEYAHGANGDGWSKGTTYTIGVNTLAVTAGFSKVGTYGAPPAVGTNTTPQTAADTNPTYGNSYVYEIKNYSGSSSGQNVTGATITIPGTDTSSANGADSSGVAWTITAAPTLTMSGGASGCSVTSYTSATSAGGNGSIVIGGASCTIPPGGTVDVNFSAKAPYKVGDTYKFGTVFTGGSPACSPSCTASEAWFSDTDVQVILSANLIVTVDPSGTGPGNSHPVPNCPTCTFGIGTVDMGTIANGSSVTGTDVVTVSVYTDAATLDPWKLYVTTNNNPSNTGSPTNELLMDVDQAASNQGGTGLNFDQTTFGVIPTSGSGMLLVDTGSGATARRLPYDTVMNYQISIQGGPLTAQTSTITFTFMAQ